MKRIPKIFVLILLFMAPDRAKASESSFIDSLVMRSAESLGSVNIAFGHYPALQSTAREIDGVIRHQGLTYKVDEPFISLLFKSLGPKGYMIDEINNFYLSNGNLYRVYLPRAEFKVIPEPVRIQLLDYYYEHAQRTKTKAASYQSYSDLFAFIVQLLASNQIPIELETYRELCLYITANYLSRTKDVLIGTFARYLRENKIFDAPQEIKICTHDCLSLQDANIATLQASKIVFGGLKCLGACTHGPVIRVDGTNFKSAICQDLLQPSDSSSRPLFVTNAHYDAWLGASF